MTDSKALIKAKQEVSRLNELREKQTARIEGLERELAEFQETQGRRVLEAMNAGDIEDPTGFVSRQLRDLRDRLETEQATLTAISDGILEAQAAVNRETAKDHREQAAKLRQRLQKLAASRAKIVGQLAELEEVGLGALSYEVVQGPPPLSARLAYEADQLERAAAMLEHGREALPIRELEEVAPLVPV
jgi:hypothetical protein